ncbi:MAG: carboxypeptidase regulatory-like domain-containing protein, partial [Acidobacteria bacterium]|nr:carboxypeptidase regulatory-like domain-containing protein [Acidobacteriota bacterium]
MHLPVKAPEGSSSRRFALAGCETSGIRWLFVLLLLGSTLGAFGQERPALAGRSLADALAVLEAQGLRLVYTDELVRPEMVVVREPSRRDLRGALLEILQPHGLGVLDGPGGTLIVVAEVQPLAAGRVRGRVRWRNSESVVAGAEVLLEPGEVLHRTDSDGLFSFDGLAPGAYRLSVSSSRGGIGTFVPQTVEVELAAGSTVDLVVEVVAVPISSERIDVFSLGGKAPGDELAVVSLGRDETESLPTLGQDVFRNLSLLPGATGAELSARPQIRGGREDEVLVRLDGLEILEAYHLKDFGSALSIVPGTVVAQVRLLSGGFPVEFGERMSGVLDLSSGIPESRHGTTLGLGIFQASASHSREIAGGQGQFLGI